MMQWGLGNNINNKISFIELFKKNFNCCRIQNVEFITDQYLQPDTRPHRKLKGFLYTSLETFKSQNSNLFFISNHYEHF